MLKLYSENTSDCNLISALALNFVFITLATESYYDSRFLGKTLEVETM